ITAYDGGRGSHVFTANSTGGWNPPAGEDLFLSGNTTMGFSLSSGTEIFEFDTNGNFVGASSGSDDRKPAAPRYSWTGTPSRLSS
ncbi:hypothetical protein NL529_31620, partial [Klebsiella pneumoniae]|nr:hypothetical protein [Klebsiella pneumoniae]